MKKKNILITGASGFIGANLTRRLLSEGHSIHILLRKKSNPWRLKSILKEIKTYDVDLLDALKTEKLISKIHPDWIFHLAAYGAYSWQTEQEKILQTNLYGTINLLNSCLKSGFETFINTGTSSEYGFKNHPPAETEFLEPNSHYALSKAYATQYCRYAAQKNKENIITLRLYSVFGSYEDPNRFIPSLIVNGMNNHLPKLVDPEIARDFIYIKDVEDAYILAASHKNRECGQVYNVGTGKQTSIRQAAALARRLFKIQDKPKWNSMPNRIWDHDVWVANNNKFVKTFNWKPKYSFEEGITKTIVWYKKNPELVKQYYT